MIFDQEAARISKRDATRRLPLYFEESTGLLVSIRFGFQPPTSPLISRLRSSERCAI